jgi:hypothetical protein
MGSEPLKTVDQRIVSAAPQMVSVGLGAVLAYEADPNGSLTNSINHTDTVQYISKTFLQVSVHKRAKRAQIGGETVFQMWHLALLLRLCWWHFLFRHGVASRNCAGLLRLLDYPFIVLRIDWRRLRFIDNIGRWLAGFPLQENPMRLMKHKVQQF